MLDFDGKIYIIIQETITTRRSVTPGVTIPAVIGVVVAGSLMLIASSLLILALCYCFCRSRKYEYKTGNEYRSVKSFDVLMCHWTPYDYFFL